MPQHRRVQNAVLLATCADARAPPPSRLARHFAVVTLPEPGAAVMTAILSATLSSHFSSSSGSGSRTWSPVVTGLTAAVVAATLEVYSATKHTLLPTPSRPHYTFNLRYCKELVMLTTQVVALAARIA
jgi:dynein heavy chain, axonemal